VEILIDIFDEDGKPTGKKKNKADIHLGGHWHKAAWIWIYNSKGEVLLQKRAKNKDAYPELWDISAAGHVDAGEEPIGAAVRELEEELGVKAEPADFKFIESRISCFFNPANGWQNNEFVSVYLYKYDGKINDLNLPKDEVECVRFVSLEKLKKELTDPETKATFTPHGEHFNVFDYLKSAL